MATRTRTRQREERRRPAAGRGMGRPVRSRRGRRPLTARQKTGTGISRRKALRRRWVALLTVLTVAAVVYLMGFTSLLGVRSVEITGASSVPADQIRAAADVPDRKPMLTLDTDGIADRVRRLPGVATVDVSRSWPSTVEISVTERTPIGFFNGTGGVHLVDGTGFDYKTVQNKPAKLPELSLARVAPDDAVTKSVIAVLTSLPPGLKDQVTSVRAKTPGGVEFTLANGKVVRWGSAQDAERKAKVLAVLLTREGNTYDVASPELPTVS
ncbi:FtsQ-type POTRA domain-containing protein [Amycolatopsis sp. K13G38]|uniref:FtsQ-type POTRA domain-containing protein n=1 Tax=Amycolatopsis acididurans TaxID=2724524 RepID=A0ABX1JEB3_9PSEU|nr:FtsQ-type POTRA domain-containing protein [Amycolatopsis acididurans]NKQ57204.1 FtsQ-type POTRA domain-containing protein [Amycolatopsis acididurans]